MKYRFTLTFIALTLFGCGSQDAPEKTVQMASSEPEAETAEQQAEPFVILELFTSEGCADCPTAEVWLNELTKESIADKTYVYPLAFHVDYWNKLGWRDIFSDAAYSNRQRAYRAAFGNEVVYTPQMVVNGISEFAGSDRERTREEMEKAMRQTPDLYFHIEPDEAWNTLKYQVVDATGDVAASATDYLMNVAIVQRGLITEVKRGENDGRTLEHENVVRYFQQFDYNPNGEQLSLAHDLGTFDTDFSIITYVQHRSSMAIVGANIWNY